LCKFASISDPKTRFAIQDSDLLLFRRRNLISIAGRGEHSHAAKAAWWDGDLFCLEVREWHGGRAVTLESQVKKFPGRIEVFQANQTRHRGYNRDKALHAMRLMCGERYGYWHIVRAALAHLPFVRLFTYTPTNDKELPKSPPFCSEACSIADAAGGVDPVPHLAHRVTEPADLRRSMFYSDGYLFTLVP
jgi:hypothetical protein